MTISLLPSYNKFNSSEILVETMYKWGVVVHVILTHWETEAELQIQPWFSYTMI